MIKRCPGIKQSRLDGCLPSSIPDNRPAKYPGNHPLLSVIVHRPSIWTRPTEVPLGCDQPVSHITYIVRRTASAHMERPRTITFLRSLQNMGPLWTVTCYLFQNNRDRNAGSLNHRPPIANSWINLNSIHWNHGKYLTKNLSYRTCSRYLYQLQS